MRNLKLQFCRQLPVAVPDIKFLLLNPNAGRKSDVATYMVTASKVYSYEISSGTTLEIAEVPGIVSAEYLALDNEICLATEMGEVLTVNPETKATNEGTYCDVGIECMAWSPDQEMVAFVTKTRNVVVMTCTYDPIAEHILAEQCGGEGQFVNVGWGKKETQFHGSEGKGAAKQKSDFKTPENVEQLPQNIEISWRADGGFFAVSFVSPEVGRLFKVFDKEGKLCYIAEKSAELQPPIAWRPSGTWIAVPQRLPNKSTIALFEKNGLRHREIVLPFDLSVEPVLSCKWNADSEILAIETLSSEGTLHNLYLYTIGNYHWYLKQLLSFKQDDDPLTLYSWDSRIGEEKMLHVLLQSGKYLTYKWCYHVDKFERTGLVAVIDGKQLLLTDFSKAIVPPPMSSAKLEIEAPINRCCLASNEHDELQIVLYDALQQLHLFKAARATPTQLTKVATLQAHESLQLAPLALGNICWLNEKYLMAATSHGNASKVLLLVLDASAKVYKLQSSQQLNGCISALCSGSAELEQFFAQTHDGKLYQLAIKPDNSIKLEMPYGRLDQPAEQLQWYSTSDYYSRGLISLQNNQCLCIDSQRIAGDVTSFCLAGNYLAFTKLSGLFFLRLSDRVIVNERKLERGGKLVTTIANDARTILQMPRGNLEAICPRVLSLEIVGALLERRSYNAALDMLRKQRINLNIICDHDMCRFVENLSVFLQEIRSPNRLNLFLSDLQNEDFTKTMYSSNYKSDSQRYPEGFKISEKVIYLCEKIVELMEQSSGEERFRLPIITAYVKVGKLEKALTLIWQQKKCESADNEHATMHAEEALRYLLYLVDVNELYNVALGTYDFGLVLFVAQKSQKDPKEFLPFLNELKTFEINYRKFKIDEHLKRYDKALQNITQCGAEKFEEALQFIKRHALYTSALKCYSLQESTEAQQEAYSQICLAFADHLRANGKLENASIMYERGGNVTQALQSAKHVLDWQRVLLLAHKQQEQSVESVALSLVAPLQEQGKYLEAFQLLKTHDAGDFPKALQCLLQGRLFLEAIFEAQLHQSNVDAIATIITPNLLAYRTVLESNLLADQELFLSYKQRLLEVRAKKAKQQQLGDNAYDNMEIDECDLLSDTTSMHSSRYTASSRGTGKTFRSSKNRRKHERKLLSLKPGNPFEDIALIDALYNHIMKIVNQQQHIRDTCKALLLLRQDDGAATVQRSFKQLLKLLQDGLDEIWIPEMMTAQQFLTGPNIDYTQLQNEQRYGMISPQKRFKPQLNIIDWEHEILR